MQNGAHPFGDLLYEGSFLYGMTYKGGINDSGVVFKIKTDGTGYDSLLNFNGSNGSYPFGSLISDGTFLYGMTRQGGSIDSGVIFKIKQDGTGYAKLFNFSNISGSYPFGSLLYDGNFLFGMTYYGGSIFQDPGLIFKIGTDGTGYSDLYNFNYPDGAHPYGTLISDGTNFYGMTCNGGMGGPGGPLGYGVIFKIKSDGTGFVKFLDLDSLIGGGLPIGSLISDGTFLYGMTQCGGLYNDGTVFKIKNDGSGFTVLLNFSGASNGKNPWGSLFSDGTYLYGMTQAGGANDSGLIFKIKPDGTGFVKLYDFLGGLDGSNPLGSLNSDGSFLYGMTYSGGVNSLGTIFKIGITTGIEENNAKNIFDVYPTPADKVINIIYGNKNAELELIDLTGELIKQKNNLSEKSAIDISNLQNGVYFLILKTDEGIFNKKIVVQH